VNRASTQVWVSGGTFTMGSDVHYPEEAPAPCRGEPAGGATAAP